MHLPTFDMAFDRLRDHADASATLALAAGCSPRTVELIRHQDDPVDPSRDGLSDSRTRPAEVVR